MNRRRQRLIGHLDLIGGLSVKALMQLVFLSPFHLNCPCLRLLL